MAFKLAQAFVLTVLLGISSCKDESTTLPTMTGKWSVEYSHVISKAGASENQNPVGTLALGGTMSLAESNGSLGGTLTGVEEGTVLDISGSVALDLSVILSGSTPRSHYTITGRVNDSKTHFLGQLSGSVSVRMEATKE